jgi:hypothetical protein
MTTDNNIQSLELHRKAQQEIHDDKIVKEAWKVVSTSISDIEKIMDETPGKLQLQEFRDAFFA